MTKLTARQVDILRLVAEGLTTDEISPRVNLSVSGVKYDLTAAYRKLGARNAAHAVAVCYQRGLLETDPRVAEAVALLRSFAVSGHRLALIRWPA